MSVRLLAALALVGAVVAGPGGHLLAEGLPNSAAPAGTVAAPPTLTAAAATAPAEIGATSLPPAVAPATATPAAVQASASQVSGSRFVAVRPSRILDSRSGVGMPGGAATRLGAGSALSLQVTGAGGVPGGASAVVLNLTATANDAMSYVAAWPSTQAMPATSVINMEYPNQTIANLVTVPIGPDGRVNFYTVAATHLIADVAGYYQTTASATAGRYTPVSPTRVLDTRSPNGIWNGRLPANGLIYVDLAALAGVPRDAIAAIVNLTVTNTSGAGYFSVLPPGGDPYGSSNLNVEAPNQTMANQAVAQLFDGVLTIYSSTGGDVIVDIAGWYTGASSANDTTGLFVPVTPARLLDTRDPANSPIGATRPYSGQVVDVSAPSRGGLPADGFAAVVLNVTATQSAGEGYFALWGAGLSRPWVSNVNTTRPSQTIANHAVVPVSNLGYSLLSQGSAHAVTDVSGYFLGTPNAAPSGYVLNSSAGPPTHGAHDFLYKFQDGSFARWDPCRAIHYKVNYVGAPPFARSEVNAAVARVEAATGIDLVDMGDLTGTQGNDGVAPAGVEAVFAFVSPSENAGLATAAGLGGGGYMPAWSVYDARVVSGFVLINETINYSQGLGPSGLQGLLLHEMGHMMGLNHVNDLGEAMYPVMHNLPNGYGPGDREGLWQLGVAQGCLRTNGAMVFANQSNPGGAQNVTDGSGGAPQPLRAVVPDTAPADAPKPSVTYCSLAPTAGAAATPTADGALHIGQAAAATAPPPTPPGPPVGT